MGHTRWATHGKPNENNAHPHRDCTGKVVVIHNGIIENFLPLKQRLQKVGHEFKTETDTEVVAHLIEENMKDGTKFVDAVQKTLKELEGHYALVMIDGNEPGTIVAAKHGPPLVVGLGENENIIASDVAPLLAYTRNIIYLEDGEYAVVDQKSVDVFDENDQQIERAPKKILWDAVMAEKEGYRHYMLKEIHEQPRAVRDTFTGRMFEESGEIFFNDLQLTADEWAKIKKVHIIACGTSWHAGLVGKFLLEDAARIPIEVDYGSEYRYRNPIIDESTLVIGVTQSGETADTIAGMQEAKTKRREADHDLQRDRRRGHAHVGRRDLHERRAGDRRGVDEGVHHAAHRVLSARALHPPAARRRHRRPPLRHARDARDPAQDRRHPAQAGEAHRGAGAQVLTSRRTSSSSAAACTTRSRWKAR